MSRYKQTVRYCSSFTLCFCTLLLNSCSSGSSNATTTTGSGTSAPESFIYALKSNSAPGIIDVFSATSTGTASPAATLALPAQSSPASLVTDSSGQIYVGCQGPDEVLVYPAGSTANATPSRSIVVPSPPFQIAVDTSGLLYVAFTAGAATPSVNVYSAGATGSSIPVRTLLPQGIQIITAIATDTSGYLYIAGESPNDEGYIFIYAPGVSGTATPSRTIHSSYNFYGLTVDPSGNLFATTDGPDLEQLAEFSPSASGDAIPANTFSLSTPLGQTSAIGTVARDASGNVYFAASATSGSYPSSVTVYTIYTLAPGFSSTSSPVRTFSPSSSIQLTIAVH